MKKLLIIILFLTMFLSFTEKSLAVDVEPEAVDVEPEAVDVEPSAFNVEAGFLFGTMRFDGGRLENSGRKFSIGLTTDFIWSDPDARLEKILGFRINTIAEPTDGKVQILDDIFAVSGRLRYKLNPDGKTVYSPFLGIEGQQWKRNSSTEEGLWGDLLLAQAVFGLDLERDNLYFEAGGLWPFLTDVDQGPAPDGELGFILSGGILCKNNIKLGLFYRREKFGGNPGSKLDYYGLSIVYRF